MKVLLLNENLFLCANMKILNAVITHKDFYWNDLPNEELKKYLVLTYNDIKTNIPNVLKLERPIEFDDRFYSEMSYIKYIRHNIDLDWVTISHYRRRLELPNYNTLYVPEPFIFKMNIKNFYAMYHNAEDLNLVTKIIMESNFNDEYKLEWLKSLEDNYMICYNMFSLPKVVFYDLVDIYEQIMNKFISIRNFKSFDDVVKYCDKLPNKDNNPMPYRIGGFLAERLTNCYFRLYAKKHNLFPTIRNPIFPCNVKLLENNMKI